MIEYGSGNIDPPSRQTPHDIMSKVLVGLANTGDKRFWDYLDRVYPKFNNEELKGFYDIFFHNYSPPITESEVRQAFTKKKKKKKPDKEVKDVFAEV
jgi:hypothetical protein